MKGKNSMNDGFQKLLEDFSEHIIYGKENIENTYKSEKIDIKQNSKFQDIKSIYSKFKKIGNNSNWSTPIGEIFYKQAKLMENFECNYKQNNVKSYLFIYKNTYYQFSFEHFKSYFTWRTNIRKGIYEKITNAYGYSLRLSWYICQ